MPYKTVVVAEGMATEPSPILFPCIDASVRFYPIKRFSGIVATPVGNFATSIGVFATPLYFVVTKCKEGGFFIRLC